MNGKQTRIFGSLFGLSMILGGAVCAPAMAHQEDEADNRPTNAQTASAVLEANLQKVTAIKAGLIIDGTKGKPIKNGVLVMRGKRIEAVGKAEDIQIPEGATIIDASNETIMPGLIDTHGHLNFRFGADGGEGGMGGFEKAHKSPGGQQMIYMIRNARAAILSGVTTMRMTGAGSLDNPVDLYLKKGIERGVVPGPRLIYGGTAVTPTGGHGFESSWADGPWAAIEHVRRDFLDGAEWMKILLIDRSPTSTMYSDEELAAIIAEAHRLGMKVTVHATGLWGSSIRAAIKAGADCVEHARPMTDEIIKLMVENDVCASLTPLVYVGFRPDADTWKFMDQVATGPSDWIEYGSNQYLDYIKANPIVLTEDRPYTDGEIHRDKTDFFPSNKTQQSQALAAFNAGVKISLGLDTIYFGGVGNAIEYLIEGGFKPQDAIRSATAVAAEIAGYGDELGTLEPGKYADIISLKANPLEQRWAWNTIHLVFKEGTRYDTLTWQ